MRCSVQRLFLSVCLVSTMAIAQKFDAPSPLQVTGDPFMGDWQGTWGDRDICAQIIARGNGTYSVNIIPEFNTRTRTIAVLDGKRVEGVVRIRGERLSSVWKGMIYDDDFSGTTEGKIAAPFSLKKVVRMSPTLGAKPPKGAIVLFDGSNLDAWTHPAPDPRIFDLLPTMTGEHQAAYLRTQVWSPEERKTRLELGSDDGVKVWLNDQLIHANNTFRRAAPGEDVVMTTLRKGWNTLVFKITHSGGNTGACAQFFTIDGSLMQGLYTHTENDLLAQNAPKSGTALDDSNSAIMAWQVSGPYSQAGKKADEIFDIAFAPEVDPEGVSWKPGVTRKFDDAPSTWKLLESGAMEVGQPDVLSRHAFTDHKLHVEFRTPFMPEADGQARGNSGVYVQGRYEVQVLDSYGLNGEWNECGGIYQVAKPRVNMAAPPLQWQTYDITFHAPRYNAARDKTRDAVITVMHNGAMIHENVSIPGSTASSIGGDLRDPQGLQLQNHGNPVQFRNIWAVELNE